MHVVPFLFTNSSLLRAGFN